MIFRISRPSNVVCQPAVLFRGILISRVFNFPFQNLGGRNTNTSGGSKRHFFLKTSEIEGEMS